MTNYSAVGQQQRVDDQNTKNEENKLCAGSSYQSHVYTWDHRSKGAYAYTRTFMQEEASTFGFGPW